jgi:hypothetical protein
LEHVLQHMIEFQSVSYFYNAFFLIPLQPLTPEKTESVNLCLALLRNILHIPERPSGTPSAHVAVIPSECHWSHVGQHSAKSNRV